MSYNRSRSAPLAWQEEVGRQLGLDVREKNRRELTALIRDAKTRIAGELLKAAGIRPGSVIRYTPSVGSTVLCVVTRLNVDQTWARTVANGRRTNFTTMVWSERRLNFTSVHNPPQGWTHALAVLPTETSPRDDAFRRKTDRLIALISEQLPANERQQHPEYGEFWSQAAVAQLKTGFEAAQ